MMLLAISCHFRPCSLFSTPISRPPPLHPRLHKGGPQPHRGGDLLGAQPEGGRHVGRLDAELRCEGDLHLALAVLRVHPKAYWALISLPRAIES